MPLSEHEQRMLEQIEKALYAEDPKFAHSVRARDPRVHYRRRVILAIIGFLLGVGLLVAGVIIKYIPMGVAGFLVMLTCAMWALTSWRHMTGLGPRGAPAEPRQRQRKRRRRGRGQPTDQGFMERLEERWRRRQEGDR
jgi:Protein of unknown function (DUF3040)